MNLQYAKDPKWANAEQTMIDLTIKWDGMAEELPFTASPADSEAHGRAIYDAALAGNFGPIAAYVPPPPPEPVVPQSVTMRQARLALLQIGKLDAVSAALAAIPDPAQRTAAQIEWEYAAVIERNSPLVTSLAAGLGLTAADIDALFEAASRI